ncbi:hypothetical protein Chor_004419 [Crotalus horridus]
MEYITTPKVENVKLLDRYTNKKAANGTLYLTATHLIYVDTSTEVRKETWILHHHVAVVEKLPLNASGCQLQIRCKNFRVARFLMVQERDCHEVYSSLLKLSQPVKPEELYAFSYNPKTPEGSRETGWKSIDVKADYLRMGIESSSWGISNICSTYSRELVVPKAAARAMVLGSAKFRSRGRIPVLSYFYKENNGYENVDNYECIRFKFIGIENIHVMRSSLQKLLEVCEAKSPSMSDFLTGLENSGWLRHIKAVMDAGVFLAKAVRDEGASVVVHCSDGWDRTAQVCSLACLLLDPFYRTLKGFMVLIEKEWIAMGHKFSHRCGHLEGDPKEVSPIFTQFLECTWQLMQQFPCAFGFNERLLLEIHDHVYSCQFGNFLGTCQKDREDLKIFEKTHSLWPFLLQRKLEFRNPLYKGYAAYSSLQPNTLPFSFHKDFMPTHFSLSWKFCCHFRQAEIVSATADPSKIDGYQTMDPYQCKLTLMLGSRKETRFWCGMYNRFDKGMHPKQCILDHLLSCTSQTFQLEDNAAELENKMPLLDGLLPNETPAFSKGVASSLDTSISPMVNTPQDYDPPVLLANGTIGGREEGGRPDGRVLSEVGLPPPSDTPNGNGCSPTALRGVPLWGSDQADLQRA